MANATNKQFLFFKANCFIMVFSFLNNSFIKI